jgi:hypothetical protein
MAKLQRLNDSQVERAAAENDMSVHEFKDSLGCGRAEYNMSVDPSDGQIILEPVKKDNPSGNIETSMYTSVRP